MTQSAYGTYLLNRFSSPATNGAAARQRRGRTPSPVLVAASGASNSNKPRTGESGNGGAM